MENCDFLNFIFVIIAIMIKLDISDLSSSSAQILAIIRNYINSNIFTSAVVEVIAVNNNKVDLQFINQFEKMDGTKQEPIKILDVLVGVIGNNNWSLSFPISVGDIGLLITSKFNLDEYKKEKKASITKIKRQYEVSSSIYMPLSLAIQPSISENIEIKSKNENTIISVTPNGDITIENKGNISVKGEEITITASNKVIVDNSSIELGTGTLESLVKTDTFVALFNSHTHTSSSPGSPTSSPLTPLTSAIGTTTVKGA